MSLQIHIQQHAFTKSSVSYVLLFVVTEYLEIIWLRRHSTPGFVPHFGTLGRILEENFKAASANETITSQESAPHTTAPIVDCLFQMNSWIY